VPVPERKKTMQILLKQETVSGSGISWDQHPTTQFFTGQMPFLPPNQQHQSTEGLLDDQK